MTPTITWLERLATEAVDRGLTEVTYAHVDTPIGRLLVAQSNQGVCRVAFPEEQTDEVLEEIARSVGPASYVPRRPPARCAPRSRVT